MRTHCCSNAMVRHCGCFVHHATPATRVDSTEALGEIFSLRRVGAAFFERSGMGILELSCCVAWRSRDERQSLGDENSWRCGDGNFGTDRDALERACEIRVARAPQSSKWIGFPECVRRFDRHWLWPLLRGWRKPACVDELDSSRYRAGFANFVARPYLSRKED